MIRSFVRRLSYYNNNILINKNIKAPEQQATLKQFLEGVLDKRHVRGNVIFSSVAGSHSLYVTISF